MHETAKKKPKKGRLRKSAFAIQSIIQLTTMAENNTFTELVTTRKGVLNCRLHINGGDVGYTPRHDLSCPGKVYPICFAEQWPGKWKLHNCQDTTKLFSNLLQRPDETREKVYIYQTQ